MEMLHIFELRGDDVSGPQTVLRIDNRRDGPLGEPLPGGQVALFQARAGERDESVLAEYGAEIGA